MCTIIVSNHHNKEFPLIIAANRDENYHRKSSPVQILTTSPHLIIGGRDDVAGGTWQGVNKESLYVGITNQGRKRDRDLESRGLVVLNALKCKTLDELIAYVEELDPSKYNAFNLVFGNNKHIYVAHSYILHSMVINELADGIHVISSDMVFKGKDDKTDYIHGELNEERDTPWQEYYKLLKRILASSDNGVKIRPRKNEETGKIGGHCTRSSSVIAFSEEGLARYKWHDRTAPKVKRKIGEPEIPRYKDYIDLWRNPEGTNLIPIAASEEQDDSIDESENKNAEIMKRFIAMADKHRDKL